MKKIKKLFISVLAISLLGLAACDININISSSNSGEPSSTPSSSVVSSSESSAVIPGDNSSSGLDPQYSSSDSGVTPSSSVTPDSSSSSVAPSSSEPSSSSSSSSAPSIDPSVSPTAISLDKYQLSLLMDEEVQINATVTPENAAYVLEWSSSNPAVATVNNGLVKAISSGSADINVTIKGTEISDKCVVSVAAPFHDYVKDGGVKLGLDYTGRDFFTDGLEKVTLLTPIDGDTAHFKTGSGTTLKARFYGIDTPESTGKVQPWGVPASNFTKEKLKAADSNGTIVVSSPQKTYGKPDPDSTGSRYVSLVWINEKVKNASLDELYLLNLWIVQEGLSMKKNVSDIPEYESAFDNAQAQAVVYKKNMWSGEDDPWFNYEEGYRDVSLLDIKREVEKSINDQSYKNPYDNMKVRFTGVVSSYSDGTLYVQEFYPIDDDHPNEGEWAGINIFCGMSEISSKFTQPNTYLQVYGLCKDSETFGFQITDTQGKWKAFGATDEDCKVLLKAKENIEEHSLYTFHYTVDELNTVAENKNCESLFCAVSVEGTLTCKSVYVSDDRALTIKFVEAKFDVYIPYAYHGDQTDASTQVVRWDTEAQFKGKKFRLDSGTYAWHRTTSGKVNFQIIPTSELTFLWINE